MKERFGDRQIPAGMKIVVPPDHPPLQHFVGDDDGRIYARTTEPDGKGGTFIDIFDPEGRYIARTSLPGGRDDLRRQERQALRPAVRGRRGPAARQALRDDLEIIRYLNTQSLNYR